MSDYQFAPTIGKHFGKLPVNHATAEAMIDTFIAPLLERAGLNVKVTKTKTTRTIKIQLPAK